MKQKKLGDILYVFDVMPYEITSDTDAEVVKVQEESFAGFIEMNPSLAEKIVKYNYHTMCVNVPEWAPYVEQEDPQEQLTFGIYGSAAETSIAQVQRQDANNNILETWVAGVGLTFPFQASFNEGEHFAVEFVNGVNPELLNITGDALSIQWQDAETNNFWRATTALSTSTSVGIDAAEPSTYKLYLSENAQSQGIKDENLRVTTNSVQVALEDLVAGIDVAEDTLVEVWLLTEDANDYNTSSISQWMNLSTDNGLHYWRNMPAEDKIIEINLVQTVTISGDAPLAYIKELTSNKSTTVNTYANPTLPVTLTVTYRNSLALSAGSSSEAPRTLYEMTPPVFANSTWTDPATGDLCSITPPIREDKSCEIFQKHTLTIDGTDILQNVTVKIDNETVSTQSQYQNVANGTVVDIYPTGNVADYVLQSGAVWDTDHWAATVNGADLTITIDYLGAGVNFNASWSRNENVSQINIGNTSVTGNDVTDPNWAETVRLYTGQSQIKYFITTGLPTGMSTFKVEFRVDVQTGFEQHYAYKQTDPDTGEVFYSDARDASGSTIANPGTWTYNNTPESGLPWIAFTLPSTDANGNAFPDNTEIRIGSEVSGS